MTRQTKDWLRTNWWQIATGLLLVGGWVARAEASFSKLHDLARDHDVVQGLGRLQCLRDRTTASAAGIPCAELMNEWRPQ